MVGIQAENILRGEHPMYYYSQPYMGSLQAHFIAAIFLSTGPSVWALRIEPLFISLFIVFLTWRFSSVLADAAQLSARTKTLFIVIATLVAALPPLYDTVEEMRATGGYVEAFAIMLWLLLCAFRLTYRWRAGASARELALRWAGFLDRSPGYLRAVDHHFVDWGICTFRVHQTTTKKCYTPTSSRT